MVHRIAIAGANAMLILFACGLYVWQPTSMELQQQQPQQHSEANEEESDASCLVQVSVNKGDSKTKLGADNEMDEVSIMEKVHTVHPAGSAQKSQSDQINMLLQTGSKVNAEAESHRSRAFGAMQNSKFLKEVYEQTMMENPFLSE
eukprot:gnl/TRDRNA2_/TRDRNA2_184718_c0_seq1.p1 gnl/TRDRNA2_/TRDRNA2_184718_c0~~gnl/TRDRNA2_/TRDRNA2_184718_c0_seq1.p1  ORF type:complete len:146 (-),score=34.16 gnl/TRDRNA2_/TRDRNA2_184718_c0_seq1:96-533(-)